MASQAKLHTTGAGDMAEMPKTSSNSQQRQRRPNYRHIHRFPLPLETHPLPPLIPHNPLSIISIALSYLTYIISPPRHAIYPAYFDPFTSSVNVTDPKGIRALWEMGFFGKGNLSRSEPQWLDREKNRRGLSGVNTNDEVTGKRRTERREWKLERARKEQEAIAEQLRIEAAARHGTTDATIAYPQRDSYPSVSLEGSKQHSETPMTNGSKVVRFSPIVATEKREQGSLDTNISKEENPEDFVLQNQEHLQLSSEEAFFLVYGLGVLQVYEANMKSVMSASRLMSVLRRHSYFPSRDNLAPLEPDDRFIVSYVAYHHFRSLGWIVRSGVKFGADLLLYNRGPVFSHAEFAVMVLPAYGHPYWSETESRRIAVAKKLSKSWWWLHCVNRVQAQVKKTLILCYVEIPPPMTGWDNISDVPDIGALLHMYSVREMAIRRWVPSRGLA